MMKKRIFAVILILVMALSFTGCIFGSRQREELSPTGNDPAQTAPSQNSDGTPANGDPTQPGEEGDPANPSSEGGKTVEEMIAEKNKVEPEISDGDVWYGKKKDVSTYLIIGVDQTGEAPTSGSRSGGGQCDVLDLVVIDEAAKSYTILQINRDTITGVDITDWDGEVVANVDQQISFAHAYSNGSASSCENVVRAVSRLLGGIDIDGYCSLRYSAIPSLNDAIGGVTVKIEDDFSKYDPTLVQGETVELHGEHALHYVRGRMSVGDGSNTSRMRRQRTYIAAFEAKVRQEIKGNGAVISNLYNAAQPYMVTNLSSGTITTLANKAATYYNNGTVSPSGRYESVTYSTGARHTAFYPDADSLKGLVLRLFYTKAS